MSLISTIIFSAVGALLGFIAIRIVQPRKKGLNTEAMGIALGIVMAVTFQYSITASNSFERINESISEIEHDVDYLKESSGCGISLENTDVGIYNNIANDVEGEIESRCEKLLKNKIGMQNRNEVLSVWTKLVTNAEVKVEATNTIIPDDWPEHSCRIQKNANVTIERIMIEKKGDTQFNTTLDSLANRQLNECEVNRIYKYYRYQIKENFGRYLDILQSMDIVVVDEKVVLVTRYNTDSRITGGYLTVRKEYVNAATTVIDMVKRNAEMYR